MAQSIRVLHIDAEPNSGDLTAVALDREVDFGVVETATSAAEGLEMIENHSLDCVLFDSDILGQNGTKLLQQVGNDYPDLPVILLTADAGAEFVNEAVSAGVTDYFQPTSEPGQYQLLINRIKNVVQSRQSTERLAQQEELVELTELTASVGGWELDVEADELNITTGASQITGLPEDADLSQDEPIDIYHPDDRPEVQAAVDRAAQTGQQVQDTWRVQPAAGSQRVVDVTITPSTSNGEVTTLRGTIQDVTERYERRQELKQIETLFQHTQGPLFLIDVGDEFTIERVNRAWEDATGIPADSAHGQPLSELLGKEQATKVAQRYRACVRRQEPLEYEEPLQFDGGPTYWKTRIAPVVIDGEVEFIAGSTTNITETRKRQEELRILQQAIDNTEVPITLADPSQEDNPLVYVNAAYEQLTGYSEKEALGRNCRYLQGEDTNPEAVTTLRTAIDAEEPTTVELRNYRKDGTEFWNRVTVTPIYDDDGTLLRYIGTQDDITERKEREQELRAERRFIKQALNALDDLFYVVNTDGTLRRWNSQLPQTAGYADSELADMRAIDLFAEDSRERITDLIESVLSGETGTVEADLLTANGEHRPYEFTGAQLTDGDGNTTELVGVGRDIADRKKRDKHLKILSRILRHNLRNDLNVVRGRAETICAEASGAVAADAEQIVEMSDKLLELTEKERQLAAVLRTEPTQKSLDIKQVLEGVTSKVLSEYPAATTTVECPAEMTIRTTAELAQAIEELAVNAIVHNDSESPEVSVTAAWGETGARIEVADSGPEIPEMERSILTDGIKEGPLSHGTGLGLGLVREIISQAGGSISYTQRSPTGNIIRIVLPH